MKEEERRGNARRREKRRKADFLRAKSKEKDRESDCLMLRRPRKHDAGIFIRIIREYLPALEVKSCPIPKQENIAKCSWDERGRAHPVPRRPFCSSRCIGTAGRDVTRPYSRRVAYSYGFNLLSQPLGVYGPAVITPRTQRHLTPRVYSCAYIQ